MNKFTKLLVLGSLVFSVSANAGSILGGDTLDQAGADLLEGYLGGGDLDFVNVSNLNKGASAAQWHADVAGYTNVISIYDVTVNGADFLIGGFSSIGHDGTGYSDNTTNYLFNLTLGIKADLATTGVFQQYDQYDSNSYFATFGGGHDLLGGINNLGINLGYSWDGSHPSNPFPQGITYNMDTGSILDGLVKTQSSATSFTVNGLESFVFGSAASVPEPSVLGLLSFGVVGLWFARRYKQVVSKN